MDQIKENVPIITLANNISQQNAKKTDTGGPNNTYFLSGQQVKVSKQKKYEIQFHEQAASALKDFNASRLRSSQKLDNHCVDCIPLIVHGIIWYQYSIQCFKQEEELRGVNSL